MSPFRLVSICFVYIYVLLFWVHRYLQLLHPFVGLIRLSLCNIVFVSCYFVLKSICLYWHSCSCFFLTFICMKYLFSSLDFKYVHVFRSEISLVGIIQISLVSLSIIDILLFSGYVYSSFLFLSSYLILFSCYLMVFFSVLLGFFCFTFCVSIIAFRFVITIRFMDSF